MENPAGKNKYSEEIDLTQFFRWIGNGFKRVGNSIFYTLALFRNTFFNNKAFFAGIIIAGLLLGVLYSQLLQREYYKASMVLNCTYLNNQIMGNTILKLNQLAGDPTGRGLAEELKISVEEAKNIDGFSFQPFVSEDDVIEMEILRQQLNNVAAEKKELVENVLAKLQIDNKDAYKITVSVFNPGVVEVLEKALVDHLRSNPYVKGRIEINRQNLLARKAKLVRESRKIDSLKLVVYSNLEQMSKASRGSNNIILDETTANPLELFKEDLAINSELLRIEHELYIRPDFEIIDGFTAFNKPESASVVMILLYAFFISFIGAYLILGLLSLDKKLASYQEKTLA